MANKCGVRTLRLAAVGAATMLSFAPHVASAGPDLVVSRDATRIEFGSCALSAPVASGEAAIANVGDADADLPLGIIDRYSRSLIAVYVPEHLDLLDHGRETTSLAPGARTTIPFQIGEGKLKRGRLRSGKALGDADLAPLTALGDEEIKEYQRALEQLKYYSAGIDGVPGRGFRAGVRAFQEQIGRPATGVLTVGEAKRLAEVTGRTLATSPTLKPGQITVTVYIVVDPYNLVAEDDESNNIETWTGVLDCS
ncbi:MAG: peptidoglycan-binding protein [Neomegalonema sp.]|nr:peptidoglycan-binding protein [Neomegalonema sp.]